MPAADLSARAAASVRDVPDFPRPGIVFKDITPLLQDAALFRECIEGMAAPWRSERVTHVAGIESRGFILSAPIAITLAAGFIPIRKAGKLPYATQGRDYALEYGPNPLQNHVYSRPPPP